MDIGLIGSGNLARTLGRARAVAGHSIMITGRDPEHARAAAEQVGCAAAAVEAEDLARRAEVVVVPPR